MKTFDPMHCFNIIGNDELKRFEFNSKTNLLTSYTIGYHEADNINDAKIAVYKALKLEAERNNEKIQDFFQLLANSCLC